MKTDLFKEDIDETVKWCNDQYDKMFAVYFKEVRELHKRLQSASRPITDDELQQILVDLPMQLFSASEQLSQYKTALEVIKLRIKAQEAEVLRKSTARTAELRKSEAEMSQYEEKIQYSLYHSVVARVENEIELAKELIMGAKKIWDARRKTEGANPVGYVNGVPEYKTPIYGGTV